jgi:peptidoglycan/LPS O-acetylase OafA/YrhL
MRGGFVGVDVFFVVSGYLITGLIVREVGAGTFSLSDFWLRRARRILPALTITALACLICGFAWFLPDDLKSLGRSAAALSVFASNVYFWLKTGYFTAPAETKPLLHTWSLAVEEQFYLLMPLLLVVSARVSTRFQRWLVAFLAASSFLLAVSLRRSLQPAALFLLPTRAWELWLGSLVVLFDVGRRVPKRVAEIASVLGLVAIVHSTFAYDPGTALAGRAAIAPCLGAAAVLASSEGQTTLVSRLLSLRPLVAMGLVSYSLYLWHWPIFVFVRYMSLGAMTPVRTGAAFVASFAVAWLSYRFVETPIRRGRILSRPRALVTASLAAMGVIGALGLVFDAREGFPERLAPPVLAAYREAFDRPPTRCEPREVATGITLCATAPGPRPDLVLWGDSHAGVMLPEIEDLARRFDLTVWYHGCIPVLDVYSVSESSSLEQSPCASANRALVALIEERHVPNVLFVSFWSQFTEGRETPLEGAGQRDPFYADGVVASSSSDEARAVFRAHFTTTVQRLTAAGARVWIMEQPPAFQFWVGNELAKALTYGGDPSRIGRPLSEHRARQASLRLVFAELASAEVRRLDPATILCDAAGFCHAADDGHALYGDFNHLSALGTKKLEPLLEPMFEEIRATR